MKFGRGVVSEIRQHVTQFEERMQKQMDNNTSKLACEGFVILFNSSGGRPPPSKNHG